MSAEHASESAADAPRPGLWLGAALALCLLDLASVVFTKLSLPAAVVTLLTFVALPKFEPKLKRLLRAAFAVAAIGATVGVLRFVIIEAVPSLVVAGNNASASSAVSRLRELLFVEDTMRQKPLVDHDGDGIGSAALLVELSGEVPLRGKETLRPALLNRAYTHVETTPIGPAAVVAGYYFIVCLPRAGGGFTAQPGEAIDEELAERRFVAYAWPAAQRRGPQPAFFLDEHERILMSENREGSEPRWAGQFHVPACDAALGAGAEREWKPWRGKKPRETLPGDR